MKKESDWMFSPRRARIATIGRIQAMLGGLLMAMTIVLGLHPALWLAAAGITGVAVGCAVNRYGKVGNVYHLTDGTVDRLYVKGKHQWIGKLLLHAHGTKFYARVHNAEAPDEYAWVRVDSKIYQWMYEGLQKAPTVAYVKGLTDGGLTMQVVGPIMP